MIVPCETRRTARLPCSRRSWNLKQPRPASSRRRTIGSAEKVGPVIVKGD